ncbi:hypothetical protein V8C37DRAFT_200719 [Trichoderma ceciliae]
MGGVLMHVRSMCSVRVSTRSSNSRHGITDHPTTTPVCKLRHRFLALIADALETWGIVSKLHCPFLMIATRVSYPLVLDFVDFSRCISGMLSIETFNHMLQFVPLPHGLSPPPVTQPAQTRHGTRVREILCQGSAWVITRLESLVANNRLLVCVSDHIVTFSSRFSSSRAYTAYPSHKGWLTYGAMVHHGWNFFFLKKKKKKKSVLQLRVLTPPRYSVHVHRTGMTWATPYSSFHPFNTITRNRHCCGNAVMVSPSVLEIPNVVSPCGS